MRAPLIAGNWKMHKTLAEARELVSGILENMPGADGVEVLVCPPVHLLFPMAKAVAGTRIMLGAQNVHDQPQGAFTGEVSVAMLKDTGCTHVIIGHSERRQLFGEDGPWLGRKVRAALEGGMTVIFCVGETLEEREAGRTQSVVERQFQEVVDGELAAERLVIAYEPVWAIGTGRTATPQQAQEVHRHIRNLIAGTFDRSTADSMRILYGGSVKPGNAEVLLAQGDIDGALVGGACLVASDFSAIMAAGISAVASSS